MISMDELITNINLIDIKFGLIKVIGDETIDFLQRISSNDFSNFFAGNALSTLFISDKGKLIDRVTVLHCGDYFIFLVSNEKTKFVIEWLNKYIIMENILLENISDDTHFIISSTPIHEKNENLTFCIDDVFGVPLYFSFDTARTRNAYPVVLNDDWEYFQLTHGIVKSPQEINEHYNPLEVNLAHLISFKKGCYIGQEIIARLDSYKKVQKALYLIWVDKLVSKNESLILVDVNNLEIGKITRLIPDPNNVERNIGLAVIRIRKNEVEGIRIKNTSIIVSIVKSFEYLYGRN